MCLFSYFVDTIPDNKGPWILITNATNQYIYSKFICARKQDDDFP